MNERGQGWILFAAIVLGVGGIMRIFDAIWAFRYHGVVPQHLEDAHVRHQPQDLRLALPHRRHHLDCCVVSLSWGVRRSAAGWVSPPVPSPPSAPSGGCPTTRSGP